MPLIGKSLYDEPIKMLDLSSRLACMLSEASILTIGGLLELVENGELVRTYGVDEVSLREIHEKLDAVGIAPWDDLRPPQAAAQLRLPDSPLADVYVDSIDVLGLSARPANALKRAGVYTVEQLVDVARRGKLMAVRNIGLTSCREIAAKLKDVFGIDVPTPDEADESFRIDNDPSRAAEESIRHTASDARSETWAIAVRAQWRLVQKHCERGWLHRSLGTHYGQLGSLMDSHQQIDAQELFALQLSLLAPTTLCDEIEELVAGGEAPNLTSIVVPRYGLSRCTLQETADKRDISRQRAWQLCIQYRYAITRNATHLLGMVPTLDVEPMAGLPRLRMALCLACEMGDEISYHEWRDRVGMTLVGRWKTPEYADLDPVETMVAICRLVGNVVSDLALPPNLDVAVELAHRGRPEACARELNLPTMPKALRRLVRQHCGHCGAVDVHWLALETKRPEPDLRAILTTSGLEPVGDDWFAQPPTQTESVSRTEVFHRAMRKVSQFCGPLSVEDISSALGRVALRKRFTMPPPDVMQRILQRTGYSSEDGLLYWPGASSESLSDSEQAVMACLAEHGKAVHHDELLRAFHGRGLSSAALHSVLRTSPLFQRVVSGVHKLRGTTPSDDDIERARRAAIVVPLDFERSYRTGRVIVRANVSSLAIGTGRITCMSGEAPILPGEWDGTCAQDVVVHIRVTDTGFSGLRKAFHSLLCEPGDRVELAFDPRTRRVDIRKVGLADGT